MRFRGLFIGGGHFIGAIALAIAAVAGMAARGACIGEAGVEGAAEHVQHADEHARHADELAHRRGASVSAINRTTASYTIPDVRLVRQDGTAVNLGAELDDGRPVVLSFIYTSCTSVCPLVSHTLAQLQSKLGDNPGRVHLVSISIDPEQDDPARLREYAKTFNAGPGWQHYTGTLAASQTVQRAFDVYRGNKMDHLPATLIRLSPGAPWTRIEGFATADQLLAELSGLAALRAAR